MRRSSLFIFILFTCLITGLVLWLITPDFAGKAVAVTGHHGTAVGSAQLKVDLKNRWGTQQLAYCGNCKDATDTPLHTTLVLPATGDCAVRTLRDQDEIKLSNPSGLTVSYDMVDLLEVDQAPLRTIEIPARGEKALAGALLNPGGAMGLVNQRTQKVDVVIVRVPTNVSVLGEEGSKQFHLPNGQCVWHWLRLASDSRTPWGIKALVTTHSILVNEVKPLTLSFETPDRS